MNENEFYSEEEFIKLPAEQRQKILTDAIYKAMVRRMYYIWNKDPDLRAPEEVEEMNFYKGLYIKAILNLPEHRPNCVQVGLS